MNQISSTRCSLSAFYPIILRKQIAKVICDFCSSSNQNIIKSLNHIVSVKLVEDTSIVVWLDDWKSSEYTSIL